MTKKKVAVIGGGPAGMMAAVAAADNGHDVTLFEKNEKLGKKLFLTGKGRCNITNDADIADFFASIVTNNKFLYAALYGFTNQDVIALLNDSGLKTKVERGGRVYPESDKSSDVIKALKTALDKRNVQYRLNTAVTDIKKTNDQFTLTADKKKHAFDAVIMATGGLSYPTTGSDGTSFPYATKMGHHTTPFEASLVSLITETAVDWPVGLTLKNIKATFYLGDSEVYSEMGELLFTHWGISGPLVLSASAYYTENKMENAHAVIDFKPALDEKTLDARLVRDIAAAPNKDVKNLLRGLLPASMIAPFIHAAELDESLKGHDITKEIRRSILGLLKAFPVKIISKRPIKEAVVTRGGIDVSEINPSTMESRIVPGLYFAGEMIDVDALTGGYNLQIAFSTGHLAGSSIQ